MEFHEAANIFPLDEENLADLAKDIREHGQQVPIETFGGRIIDGRRRWKACQLAGVKAQIRAVLVDDPIAYVLSLNLHRRHLSATQLSMVGARARAMYDEKAKERQKATLKKGTEKPVPANLPERGKDDAKNPSQLAMEAARTRGDARDQVGKVVGVSGKSIDSATKVLEAGTPKLIAAVDADLIAVSTAARAASRPEEEQDALADRAKETAESGHRRRPRPTAEEKAETEEDAPTGEPIGVGVFQANEAINCLIRIPKNDRLRKRGFQIVTDWIKANR